MAYSMVCPAMCYGMPWHCHGMPWHMLWHMRWYRVWVPELAWLVDSSRMNGTLQGWSRLGTTAFKADKQKNTLAVASAWKLTSKLICIFALHLSASYLVFCHSRDHLLLLQCWPIPQVVESIVQLLTLVCIGLIIGCRRITLRTK